jgi:FixJ family two-component response regulator
LTYETPEGFLSACRPTVPGCLILDVRLRGVSGLKFQRELKCSGIEMPVVFITGHGDVPMSVAAMKAGAVEFLLKPFRDQELLDAVREGIERDRARRAHESRLEILRRRYAALTSREREIMPLVAAGLMNKQIAHDLGLSEATVKVHRAQVMQKLAAGTLADLVRIADELSGDRPGA